MDYAKMRAIAEELGAYAEQHPEMGRMRRPDAVVIPDESLDEEGVAVDATDVLAVIGIVSPSNPSNDYIEKLADYPAMGIAHYLIVDPAPARSRPTPIPARAVTPTRTRTSSATPSPSGPG
ncbi:Uma2 family endonuclease [Streptomyces sp. DT195]|uniref:Uma2 family endonuclease n=1 Tax=Streptomyces sp. DT195 TaxID=3393419 RepID=UPI003CEB53C5